MTTHFALHLYIDYAAATVYGEGKPYMDVR